METRNPKEQKLKPKWAKKDQRCWGARQGGADDTGEFSRDQRGPTRREVRGMLSEGLSWGRGGREFWVERPGRAEALQGGPSDLLREHQGGWGG